MNQMSAVQYNEYGPPEVLHVKEIDAPSPKSNEALVRVLAASINGIDLTVRSGELKLLTGRKFPRGTGLDFVGELMTLGDGASGLSIGNQVWGALRHGQSGSLAQYVCCLPEQLSLAPGNLNAIDAAALPAVGVTAITLLCEIGNLRKGQRLLIRGASGGVGSAAVQLGHELGAHVTALARASHLNFVRELGADDAVDYAAVTPAELGKFDHILDTVGSDISAFRRLLTKDGRMTTLRPDPSHPLRSIAAVAMSFVHGSRRVRMFSAKPARANLTTLAKLVTRGVIRPLVDGVYSLAQASDAHRAMEGGGRRGKQVIQIAS